MARACTVCRHGERGTIDAMLARGTPLDEIARRYGVGRHALYRHRKGGHIPEAVFKAHKARQLRGEVVDLGKLRTEESEGLLLNLASQRATLQEAQKRAHAAEQWGNVAALGAQVHRNLQLVGTYLGELGRHETRVTHNLIVTPEYMQLRATIQRALAPFPEARRAVAAALREVEGGGGGPEGGPPLIEGRAA